MNGIARIETHTSPAFGPAASKVFARWSRAPLTLAMSLVLLAVPVASHGATAAHEPFNYATGAFPNGTATTGNGFTGNWTCGIAGTIVAGLTYSGLPVGNNALESVGSRQFVSLASPLSSGTKWISFLFRSGVGNSGGNMNGIYFPNGGTGLFFGFGLGPVSGTQGQLGLGSMNTTPTTAQGASQLTLLGLGTYGTTYLVVLQIEFNTSGNNDTVTVYLNPVANQGTPGVPAAGTHSAFDVGVISGVGLNVQGAGSITVDEIRVGDTYADVVSAQQTIYNRNDSGTGFWWHGNLPWWYSSLGNQNRPDNDGRGNVIYDHNNDNPDTVNGAWFNLRTLTFESGASAARAFNKDGDARISLTVGLYNESSGTKTFNVPIGVDGNVEFAATSGQLSFTDNFFGNDNSMTFSGNNNITVSGVMSGSGGGTITKTGSGVLTLSNAGNSHDKMLALNAGVVSIGASRHLGADPGGPYANKITLNGGTLRATDTFTMHVNNLTTLGAGHGTIEVPNSSHTLTYNPVISGASRNLTKTGSGTLTLSGNNTYSGNTTLSAGTLEGRTSANAFGSGSLLLSGAGSTLQLRNSTALNFARPTTVSANLTISSGRTSNGAGVTHTLGTLGIGANTLSLVVGPNVTSGTAGLSFGAATLTGEPTFDVGVDCLLTFNSTVNNGGHLMTVQGAGDTTVSGVISGNGALTKSGVGTLTLSGANSIRTGTTTINGGTVVVGATKGLGEGTITVNGGTLRLNSGAYNAIHLNSAVSITIGSGATLTADNSANNAHNLNGTVTLNGGTLTSINGPGGAANDGSFGNFLLHQNVTVGESSQSTISATRLQVNSGVSFNVGAAPASLLVSSVIQGSSGFTKTGAGTLTLTGVNVYSGTTAINQGTLALSGSGAIASSPNIVLASGAGFNISGRSAALTLASGQKIVANATGANATSTITVGGTPSLTLASNAGIHFAARGSGSTAPLTVTGSGGSLNLNNAPIQVTTTTALGVGTYTMIAKSGSAQVTGTPGTLTIDGSGLGSGLQGSLSVVSGELILTVAVAVTVPTVTTSAASAIGTTSANAGGNVTSDGGATVTERGVVWNTTGSPTTSDTKVSHASGGTGSFTVTLTGLTPGQTIHHRAYAISSQGTAYGSTLTFNAACFTTGPTIQTASSISQDRFTANWSAVGGATGYRLDVNTSENFTGPTGFETITFGESGLTYTLRAFGSAASTIMDDPAGGGNQVMRTIKPVGAETWAGTVVSTGLNESVDVVPFTATETTMAMRVYPPAVGIPIMLKLENAANGAIFVETLATTTVANEWETLTFDFANHRTGTPPLNLANTYNKVVVFPDFGTSGNGATYYFDDITFGDGGGVWILQNEDVGNFTNHEVTGLDLDTTYYYRVRAVNDYCTSGNSSTESATTLAALALEPTTQAHTVTFNTLGSTSMGVAWTSGNGAGRLVIARQGSAPSAGPIDGTPYTADASFGASPGGSALGDGKVVYIGAGNSFTLTGLSAQTQYYLQVYEFNGSGSTINYLTTTASGNPGNRFTLSNVPTGHVADFDAVAASSSQINLSWTAAAGPPSGYLVLQRVDADPTGTPDNGESYSVGNTIGDGTVAAIVTPGSATSANIVGLDTGVTYHYSIIPFNWNGSNAQTYNYRTAATIPTASATISTAPTVTTATPADPSTPPDPSQATAGGEVSGSGASSVTERGVVWGTSTNPTTGDNKVAHASGGGGTFSVTLTGLAPGEVIHYRAYAINDDGTFYGSSETFTADVCPGGGAGGASVYEPFDYTTGSFADGTPATGAGLTGNWTSGPHASIVAGLTYDDLPVGNNALQSIGNAPTRQFVSLATPLEAGTKWISFLFMSTGNAGGNHNGIYFPGSNINSLWFGFGLQPINPNEGGLWLGYTPTTTVPPEQAVTVNPLTALGPGTYGQTYLVVLRIDLNGAGNNDTITAYLNPVANQDTPGVTAAGVHSTFDVGTIEGVGLNVNGGSVGIIIDEIRIGDTYAEVVGAAVAAGPPTTQATDITFSSVTENGMNVSWTSGDGAAGRLVIAREGSAPSAGPDNGTEYTADADFSGSGSSLGGGKVVYIGTGNSFSLTGLSAETEYHLQVYEFSGCYSAVDYLTSTASGNPASRFTASTVPTGHVGSFTATATSSSQIDLSWTAATGPPSGYLILRRVGGSPTGTPNNGQSYSVGNTLGDGTVAAIVTPGSATSAEITGLSAGTTHHFSIIPFNWDGVSDQTYHYRTAPTIPTAYDTTATERDEIKDQFVDYSGTLHEKAGGTGWTDTWAVTMQNAGGVILENSPGSLPVPDGYAAADGDKVGLSGRFENLVDAEFYAIRHFHGFSSGRIYASGIFQYEWNNLQTYLGLSFMEGGVEQAFVGRPGQDEEKLGVDTYGYIQQLSPRDFYGNNTYAVIAMYDFTTKELKGWIYNANGEFIPQEQPEADITVPVPPDRITTIDGIKIVGGKNLGYASFDEVRVSDSWRGILGLSVTDPDDTPTAQATEIWFDEERKHQIRVGWVRGGGANALVVAYPGTTWPEGALPEDGETYGANTVFGSGDEVGTGTGAFVVYNGSALNSVIMTGLEASSAYIVRVFEYNDGIQGTKYLTTPATGNPAVGQTLTPPVANLGLAGVSTVDINLLKFNERNVMIVWRQGSAVTWSPTDQEPYSDNQDLGDGQFILNASTAATFLQHGGRTQDTTYHYRFFSVRDVYYSEGADYQITTTESQVIYEPFDYFHPNQLNLRDQGTGWGANNWACAADWNHNIEDANFSAINRSIPEPIGRRAWMGNAGNGGERSAERMFGSAFHSGVVYISWMMMYQHNGSSGSYIGIDLMTGYSTGGGVAKAFIGKLHNSDNFGIDASSAAKTESGQAVSISTEYFCVLKYDFDTGELSAQIYHGNRMVGEEPTGTTSDSEGFASYWDVTTTQTENHITSIAGIRIRGGQGWHDHDIGEMRFDEIRAGTTWESVTRRDGQTHEQMMTRGPVPELIYIGPDYVPGSSPPRTFVYDAELNDPDNRIDIAVRWTSPHGIFVDQTDPSKRTISTGFGNINPNWDPLIKRGESWNALDMDVMFTGRVGINGGTEVITYHLNAFSGEDFTQWAVDDEFFITVSAQTFPGGATVSAPNGGLAVPVHRAMTINYPLRFTVTDDDPEPPVVRGFDNMIVTDADMRAGGVELAGEVRDFRSGVLHDSLWFTLVNANNETVFENQPFATRPVDGGGRTEWAALGHGLPAVDYEDNRLGEWTIWVNATDADDDGWEGDALSLDPPAGFTFTVVDDDTEPPEVVEFLVDGVGLTDDGLLRAGGIAVIGVNGHPATGDGALGGESFSFVVLRPFAEGTRIWFTDAGWSNYNESAWANLNEFHTAFWDSDGARAVGDVVTLVMTNLNNAGDQMAVYQYVGETNPKDDPENINWIYALNMGSAWLETHPGGGGTNNQNSALYSGLTNEVTAIDVIGTGASRVNWHYTGPRSGSASDLLLSISTRANWQQVAASTDLHFDDIFEGGFNVLGPGDLEWDVPILTDAQINQGTYSVDVTAWDLSSGLQPTVTAWAPAPSITLFNTNEVQISAQDFTASFTPTPNQDETFSVASMPGGNYDDIVLGVYTARFIVADNDNDRPGDSLIVTNYMPVMVVDDDPYPPRIGPERMRVTLDDDMLAPSPSGVPELLAGWNFNDEADRFTVSHGEGTMTYILNGSISWFVGSSINLVGGDVAGDAFSPAAAGNIGGHFQFELDMSEHMALELSFAVRRTTTGYNNNQVSYSLDGLNFTPFGAPFDPTTSATLERMVFDFSSVPQLNGAAQVFIRIMLDVDGVTGGGNNRYDNIQFNAYPLADLVFEITDAQLAQVSTANPLRFGFNVYDPISGVARGSTHDGINMVVSIPGLYDEDASRFDSGVSHADTTVPESLSFWGYDTEIPYEDRGVLYGDGTILRPVTATFADMDDDRPNDRSWYSNAVFASLRIIDDDEDPPEVRTHQFGGAAAGQARALQVTTNVATPQVLTSTTDPLVRGPRMESSSNTGTVFVLTDEEMANPAAHGIRLAVGALDAHSGVSRGNVGDTNTVMSLTMGDIIVGNMQDFDAALSTPGNPTNTVLTNVWTLSRNWTDDEITDMVTGANMRVSVRIPDLDDDRPNDRAILEDHQVGFIKVVDDDVYSPLMGALDLSISSTHNLFVMGFEAYHGWTNAQHFTYLSYTAEVNDEDWIVNDVQVAPLTGAMPSHVRAIGMRNLLVNDYQESAWMQMPPREDPGMLFAWARLSAAGSREVVLEGTTNDTDWVDFGSREITSNDWVLVSWPVNEAGEWTLRLRRTTTGGTPTVYLDDIVLTKLAVWKNATNTIISFAAAEDQSGVAEYRHVVAAAPAWRHGTNISEGAWLPDHAGTLVALPEGTRTGFVFAVDADMDRSNDQLRNPGIPYLTRIDRTPPERLAPPEEAPAEDPLTTVALRWTPAEDPGELRSIGGTLIEELSPWDTYRVYVAEGVLPCAEEGWEGAPCSDEEIEAFFAGQLFIDATENPELAVMEGQYDEVEDETMVSTVISNLIPGVDYTFAVAGRDRAGNLGPPSLPIVIPTQDFYITNAVAISATEARFEVRSAVNRKYDLLHVNAVHYGDQLTNLWANALGAEGYFVGKNEKTRMIQGKELPFTLVTNAVSGQPRSQVRFVRAAPQHAWTNGRPFRIASQEIYMMKQTPLRPGQNWVAFPGIPDSNRVDLVLGTYLPAGSSDLNATRVNWFKRGSSNEVTTATNMIYLVNSDPPRWTRDGHDNANDIALPLQDGFIVILPTNAAPTEILLVGRVPMTNQIQTLSGGGNYNLIGLRTPRSMHPSELFNPDNNPASGNFTGGALPIPHPTLGSDMLWKYDRNNQRVQNIVYYNTGTGQWLLDSGAPVPSNYFQPDDAIVFFSGRSTASISITNQAALHLDGSTNQTAPWRIPNINMDP